LSGKQGVVGKTARLWEELRGQDSSNVYAAMSNLTHAITVAGAGLSQTKTEMEKVDAKTGKAPLDDPATFFKRLDFIKEALYNDLAAVQAGAPADALDKYNTNMQEFPDAMNVFKWTPKALDWNEDAAGPTNTWAPLMQNNSGMSAAQKARLKELRDRKAEREANANP
jgi:hypothetical protein